jgi:hypothetical protein
MRALALVLLPLLPGLALAEDGAPTVCLRNDHGKDAPIVCHVDGAADFTAVPAGYRLDVTDVVFGSWAGRLEATSGGTPVWWFPILGVRAGDNGASFAFHTPLGVPAGASLATPGNGGAVLVSGRLVATGS